MQTDLKSIVFEASRLEKRKYGYKLELFPISQTANNLTYNFRHELEVHGQKDIEQVKKSLTTTEVKQEEDDSDGESQLEIDMTSTDDVIGLPDVTSSKDILNSLLEELPRK